MLFIFKICKIKVDETEMNTLQLITRNNASVMIQKRMKTGKRLHVILTTWKRDRKIEITQNGGNYQLNENGFKHFQASKLNQQKCISVLKERMNIEFPRSHQIYIAFK